jgi:deoxycytidylate deaminase
MDIERYICKLETFFGFAESISHLSTCKRLQCGAIVFPIDCTHVLSIGYNGPPAALPNDSCTNEQGQCGCIHAEINAIAKLGAVNKPCIMYCTTAACEGCARLILNCSSIVAFAWRRPYRTVHGLELLNSKIRTFNVKYLREDSQYHKAVEWLCALKGRNYAFVL